MEPNTRELELSKVRTLLDETDGKGFYKNNYRGYHPAVYCQTVSKETADKLVKELCARCQMLDLTSFSLELQIWWRDHEEVDKKREAREKLEKVEAVQEKIDNLSKAELAILKRIPDWKCLYEATNSDIERLIVADLRAQDLVETRVNIDAGYDIRACLLKGVLMR
jgi:hypothetical protein